MEDNNGQYAGDQPEELQEADTLAEDQAEQEITEQPDLAAELQEQKDKFLRLSAEFDNFRRRTAKEKMELIQTAGKEIITSMLDVLDDFERAEKQMENSTDIAQVIEGNQLIMNKFRNVLQQKGLTPMSSVGQPFDVEKHEAITEIEAGPAMQGKVVDEVVKGYYLNDKLIRFAKVVVGK